MEQTATTIIGMPNLAKSVIAVMKDVKGIEKNSNVGVGNAAYKGVKDEDVKRAIGESMAQHGLCIFPVNISPTVHIDRWEENTNYGVKPKQSVLTEVISTFVLMHTSGESITLTGYGHGIDTQDKSAGKATTYALKNLLLYTFMVPTGKIDDADNHHSDEYQTPPAPVQQPQQKTTQKTPEAKPPKELTEANLKKVLASDAKGITATLNAISKGTVIATTDQFVQLEKKLDELTTKPADQKLA